MKKTRSKVIVVIIAIFIIILVAMAVGIIWLAYFSSGNVNSAADEILFDAAHTTTLTEYYTNASDSGEYAPKLSKSISLGGTQKSWISLDTAGDIIPLAFIAAEDRDFYAHRGVNLARTAYAVLNEILHLHPKFGASTITQQVIKNISGDNELTWKRKLAEIIRAYNIEKSHTKDEILEVYINIVPMGEGIVGVDCASRIYFGKEPAALTVWEAATLVGITNAPTRYNPHSNPERCLKKRNAVLYAMADIGAITDEGYKNAIEMPLGVLPLANEDERIYSWFTETVNADIITALCEKYGMSKNAASVVLSSGGLKIYTTESERLQNILDDYFSSDLFENRENMPEFAFCVCDSLTGELVAIIGSGGKKQANLIVNHATVPHTPGSALKPLALYAPLIDSGRITAATVFDDTPIDFIKNGDSLTEYPKNYPNVYNGLINVKDALRLSKNTVAIRLYKMLGEESIYRSLRYRFGFDTLVRSAYNSEGGRITDLAAAPLALGQLSYGVTLRALTEAYTVFPREGVLQRGTSFVAVYGANGDLILDGHREEDRIFSKEGARLMNQLLMGVTENGTASRIKLKNSVDTAGKTGTSGDDRDRLFIGYTPYLTAGIWCGYTDGTRAIGHMSTSHITVWDEVMRKMHGELLANTDDSDIRSFSSSGLVWRNFCRDSGAMATDVCALDPRGDRIDGAYFIRGSEPMLPCEVHVLCRYSEDCNALASEGCPYEGCIDIALLKIPARAFPKEIFISDAPYVYHGEYNEKADLPQNNVYSGIGYCENNYTERCKKHSGEFTFGKKRAIIG